MSCENQLGEMNESYVEGTDDEKDPSESDETDSLNNGPQDDRKDEDPSLKSEIDFDPLEQDGNVQGSPANGKVVLIDQNVVIAGKELHVSEIHNLREFLSFLGGEDHKQAIKRLLHATITDELCDSITWKIAKPDKLVVGEFFVFKVIATLIIALWKGYTLPSNPQVEVLVTQDSNITLIKDWIKRSSARIAAAIKCEAKNRLESSTFFNSSTNII
ncbi:hypothetical protein QAD02_014244 [Eretmocerus hayati]|uniref:Uncharacterized protein n=1 Tax=Eretmocerus hayati TaxID=131215 RepID=A0ACC2P4X5_9HYME|nr:hypothetical protein QAD02_014244 [Eretmocerus hayati]